MSKMIWILGSPRSGTTYATEFIGKHVDREYNEPWQTHPIETPRLWKFPPKAKTIVFKYCENWRNIHTLMHHHPDSHYVHVWRDPDNVVYSMAYPKEDSYPPRNLYGGLKGDEKLRMCMQRWYSNMMHCLHLWTFIPKQYTEIRYERMRAGLKRLSEAMGVKFDFANYAYKSKNLEDIKLNWDLNPAAKELKVLVNKFQEEGEQGQLLSDFITKRRPKMLHRVII